MNVKKTKSPKKIVLKITMSMTTPGTTTTKEKMECGEMPVGWSDAWETLW